MEGFQPVRLAYNTHEPASGADESLAPIVFLHGLMSAKEHWFDIPQIVADATKRRCYAVDSRNHGDSEWSDHFNFDLNVEDLLHFLDTQGINKAVIVGHSMGGVTALRTALKRPDRVERIVVEDMYVRKFDKQLTDMLLGYMKMIKCAFETVPEGADETATRQHLFEFLLANVPPWAKHLNDEDMKSKIDHILLKRDADGRRFTTKANMAVFERALSDLETLVSEPEGVFHGPALFMYGTLSPMKVGEQEEEQTIKNFFPNAVLEAVETDHSIHINKKEEFTNLLLKFVSSS